MTENQAINMQRPAASDTTEKQYNATVEDGRLSTNFSKTLGACSSSDSSDDIDRMRKSRYEIPDNQLSRKAANILAGRKEVEMHEFYGRGDDNSESDDRKLVLVADPSGDRDSPEND